MSFFSLLIQEKLNFAFDYLIVAAVFLILIDAFKCANQDFKEIRILHKLTKWMSIILLIRKIRKMIKFIVNKSPFDLFIIKAMEKMRF